MGPAFSVRTRTKRHKNLKKLKVRFPSSWHLGPSGSKRAGQEIGSAEDTAAQRGPPSLLKRATCRGPLLIAVASAKGDTRDEHSLQIGKSAQNQASCAGTVPPATLAAPSPGLLTRGRVAWRLGLRLTTTQSTGMQLHPIVGKRGVRYLDCIEVDAARVRGQRSNRRKFGLRSLASVSRLQAVGAATWSRGGYIAIAGRSGHEKALSDRLDLHRLLRTFPELRAEDGPVPSRLSALGAGGEALFAWREVARQPLQSDDDE